MHALIRIVMILGSVLLLGLGTIRIAHAADARADTVAMVTDVQGKATLSTAGIAHDISILTEIADQSQIDLAQATRLVALWLRSGEEFAFVGPAAIRFTSAGPQVLSGAQPTRRPSGIKDIRIRTSGVTQAAVVMRSAAKTLRIRLLTLVGTRTLDPNPEFRWQPIPGVRQYRFELADVTGRALHETELSGDTYRLPESVKLAEGATYTWALSTRLPDGRKYLSSGDFSIAPRAQREQFEAIRPSADAPLAERVTFALWLEQQELRDEARKYWKDAAVERPEDAKLRQLAGE